MLRRAIDHAVTALCALAALSAAALLFGIASYVTWRGAGALDLSTLFSSSGAALGSGGILYQLLGSLLLVGVALLTVTPLAIGLALMATAYSTHSRQRGVRLLLLGFNGIPSIVLGIVGLTVFGQLLGWGKSWLAGSLALAFMILPTVTLSLIERIDALPSKYYLHAAALGLDHSQAVRSVVLSQSLGGLVSGLFLGLARAIGETAPILFTAVVFSGVTLPTGIQESPVLALPYHIFVLAQDSFEAHAVSQLWASAAVLLAIVLVLNVASLAFRKRAKQEASHG